MNQQEVAAWELHLFLTELCVQYAIIGGMAVLYWGEARFTQDVDITILAPLDNPAEIIRKIFDRFPARLQDAMAFARRNRVILVRASNECPVDISLGLPGFEEEVMRRTVDYELETGKRVRICSAEDLIIHKAVAGRPQDVRDIEGIVYRRRDILDTRYVRHWLHSFAEILADSEIEQRFERPWQCGHAHRT